MEAAAEKASASVETVGKYVPIAELGRGGMATAYLTSSSGPGGFNKLMVVKRLRPALAAEPDFLRMFLDEARLAARIDHPNIIHTSEVGFDGANYFIAMEFVDGQPLENVIRRTKQRGAGKDATPADREAAPSIPLNLHLHILTKVLEALDFAHELKDFDGTPLNVVHRDVSPHNVMVTYDGHVKLLDFGIAKAADSTADTRTGFLKGKCAYMAPEQFGGANVDRRADVFAAGIMLWQALTSRRLWRGLTDTEIFGRLAKAEIPSPRTIVPDLDARIEQICMKSLEVDPAKRYATAAEFQAALEDYIASKPELRAAPRDVGKFVADLFTTERAKIQGLVESQINKAKRNSGELMNLAEYFGHSGTAKVDGTPSLSTQPSAAAAPSRTRLVALLVTAVCLVGVIAAAMTMRSRATEAAGGPPAQTTPATAQVTIRVQPAEAKVTFDAVALSGSPPSGAFPLDNAHHRVRVEAPGFVAKDDDLLLDSSRVTMDIALEHAAAASNAPAATAASAESQAPPTAAAKPKQSWTWHPPPVRRSGATPAAEPAAPSSAPSAAAAPPPPPSPPAPTRQWPSGPALDKSDPWGAPAKP